MLAMDLIIRALSDAVPERAAAGHVGDSWNVTLVGEDDNGLFLSGESLVGGWGAYEGGDGESALIHSAAGDFKNFPVETMEQRYPLRILQHGLRKDSGGVGRWTGGMGIVREYEVLSPCRLQLWFERVGTPSWGLSGGGDGAPPDVSVILPGQKPRQIFKVNAMPIPAGTRVLVKTGGGGGWGIPQEKGAG
jgi:N-methylhydantoinase B